MYPFLQVQVPPVPVIQGVMVREPFTPITITDDTSTTCTQCRGADGISTSFMHYTGAGGSSTACMHNYRGWWYRYLLHPLYTVGAGGTNTSCTHYTQQGWWYQCLLHPLYTAGAGGTSTSCTHYTLQGLVVPVPPAPITHCRGWWYQYLLHPLHRGCRVMSSIICDIPRRMSCSWNILNSRRKKLGRNIRNSICIIYFIKLFL